MTRDELIQELIRSGYLKTPLIIEAFRAIDRRDFVPEEFQEGAYSLEPLPIGEGQTISSPVVVASMLEDLEPEPGEKILDVGSGSGWTTTLFAYIVGKDKAGKVIGIDRIPELKALGEKNCAKYNFVSAGIAEFVSGDGSKGYPEESPFDAIHAAAALAKEIPAAWKEQIKIGGRIIAPRESPEPRNWFFRQNMWLLVKKSKTEFEEKELPGLYAFVPLIEE
ncbi:MAG: protein-L-isoaspartate O-methyltransferase [Parcubacteria group bacterium]|nr:protein-L-isoaspartate O-methyltransferase [Parcubacteria group bacterium]